MVNKVFCIISLKYNVYIDVNKYQAVLLELFRFIFVTDLYIFLVKSIRRNNKKQLKIDDLQEVFSALKSAAIKWFNLGLALGIKYDNLESIKSDNNGVTDCLREMLAHWLRSSPSRTWTDICNGLRNGTVELIALADKIEEEHCSGGIIIYI